MPFGYWNNLRVGDVMVPADEYEATWLPDTWWKVVEVTYRSSNEYDSSYYSVVDCTGKKWDHVYFSHQHALASPSEL